jgi:hypothetical protein
MISGRDMYDVVNVTRLNWSMRYYADGWIIGECRLFVFVQFSDLWSEVIVRFVDTGANVYPQYLNFLFISLAFLSRRTLLLRIDISLNCQNILWHSPMIQRHVRRGKCDTVKLVNGILAFPLMITGRNMYDVVNVTRLNWLSLSSIFKLSIHKSSLSLTTDTVTKNRYIFKLPKYFII